MRVLFFSLFIGFHFLSIGQSGSPEQFEKEVKYLSSDEMMGREVGSEGQDMAAAYIEEQMIEAGLSPKGIDDAYIQEFSITPKANPHSEEVNPDAAKIVVKNVIGFIDNQAEQTIVIGAHYDHLGNGGEGSLYAGEEKQIHNGADDNASGVSIMLELARTLSHKNEESSFNFLFIAFSGEERGLWGSNYFCKNPTIELENVNYMINLDMVGRFDEERGLAINGVGTAEEWKGLIAEANVEEYKLGLSESGVGPSDHTSFYLKDIPVLHFFTGQHADYHKPSDDADKLNYQGMAEVNAFILRIIEATQGMGQLQFQKTKDESEDTPRFTVSLGVMPDYMFQGEGMRIDGVSEGKPAKAAKLEAGDVVIQLGPDKVSDMMSYMKALSKFKKGDKTKVVVNRDGKKITRKIQF